MCDYRLDEEDNLEVLSDNINWVDKGAVTPVKIKDTWFLLVIFYNWCLEGAYYIKYGKLESFSEQQLVSCDNFQHGGKDHGCNGGLMDNAFTWIEKNGGLCLNLTIHTHLVIQKVVEIVKIHAKYLR